MTIVLRPRRSVELATLLVSNCEGIVAHHFAHLQCAHIRQDTRCIQQEYRKRKKERYPHKISA
jgi:hypothetical protein